jgi:hypothetical protein
VVTEKDNLAETVTMTAVDRTVEFAEMPAKFMKNISL